MTEETVVPMLTKQQLAQKAWREKNKEKIRAYHKAWREKKKAQVPA